MDKWQEANAPAPARAVTERYAGGIVARDSVDALIHDVIGQAEALDEKTRCLANRIGGAVPEPERLVGRLKEAVDVPQPLVESLRRLKVVLGDAIVNADRAANYF
jgi:hypothetical protein